MCAIMPGSPVQLLVALLVILAYLLLVLKAGPYKGNHEDSLAFLTSLCLSLSLILGFAIITDDNPDKQVFDTAIMGVILVVINVTPFLFLLFALFTVLTKGPTVGVEQSTFRDDSKTKKNTPRVQVKPILSRTQIINSINAAVIHNKVVQVQKSSAMHLQTHTDKVLQQQSTANRRLQQRLSNRSSIQSAAHSTIIEERIVHSLELTSQDQASVPFQQQQQRQQQQRQQQQQKCTNTKAVLLKCLGAEEKLHTFVQRADKKHGKHGMIQRKHVQLLVVGVRNRFHSTIAFDDDVWQSMKKNSKLEDNMIEHSVLAEWVFGDDMTLFKAIKNTEKKVKEPRPQQQMPVVVVHSEPESASVMKCKNTKAVLLKFLETKEKLQECMKNADKRHPLIIRRKNVKKMIAAFLLNVAVLDDDVWQSMKEKSRLVNNLNAIEHAVLEQWVFGGGAYCSSSI
jgi:hypothetical protein